MKLHLPPRHRRSGIALLMVMLMVLALMVVAGTFAYSIKVETKLAINTQSEADLEWLGRSGVEFARWILAEEVRYRKGPVVDSLKDFWAGGPGPMDDPDNPFAGVSMKGVPCGSGRFSIQITDAERRIPINRVSKNIFEHSLGQVGGDAGESQLIFGALQDWIDRDSAVQIGGGAEDDFYLGLNPPYHAKNAPISDLTELLKLRGMRPELFWGPRLNIPGIPAEALPPVGLADLYCALSSGSVNVNTASVAVLEAIAGGLYGADIGAVQNAIRQRAGLDGSDGTFDDTPFQSGAQFLQLVSPAGAPIVPGGAPGAIQPGAKLGPNSLVGFSSVFEVRVEAELGGARRQYLGIIHRVANNRNANVVYFRAQ